MFSKLKINIFGLIFVACLFVSILWAAELVIPLPADVVKITEESSDLVE